MADNTVLNSGSGGDTIASDDIGGVKHQRVKLSVGADGTATDAVPISNGLDTTGTAVQAVGLVAQFDDTTPSSVTENQFGPVRMSTRRALLVEGVASGTAVTVDGSAVTQPVSAASLPLPTGAATAANQSTIIGHVDGIETLLGTIDADTSALAGAVSGAEVQVDVVAALPAGTNNIGDVDVLSVVPGTGATNLGKAEDAAHTTGDVGVMALAVRRDNAAASSGTDGDYEPLSTDATGQLRVTVGNTVTVTGAGGTFPVTDSGGSLTVDGTVTAHAGTGPWPVTDNGGTLSIDDGAGSITVDGTVAVSGTVTVDSELTTADLDTGAGTDTRAVVGLVGAASGGGALIPGSATDGLLVNLGTNNDVTVTGTVTANLAAGTNNIGDVDILSIAAGDNNIGNVDIVTMPNVTLAAGTNTNEVVGDAAHDAAIAGNPVRIAGRALTADYTAVAAGDTADIITTLLGKQVVMPYANPSVTWSYAAASGGIVNTTGVTAKAAAGAGVRNYITRVQVVNGHATVSTDVQIRDGAAGTVLWRGFAQAAGGGVSADFDPPLRGTANTLVEVACGTTGSATYFNLQGFTAAE